MGKGWPQRANKIQDDDDDDDCDDDDYDLYIIGAVCLSQKSLFLYSKDLVVSYISRHF